MRSSLLVIGLWAILAAAPGAPAYEPPADHDEAQEDEHQPRHGGLFGDADDVYHYEVLLEGQRLIVYVNDEHNTPLDATGLQGRWTLDPDSDQPVEGALAPAPDGAFLAADLPATGDPVHVKVEVLKGDVWAPMEFVIPLDQAPGAPPA